MNPLVVGDDKAWLPTRLSIGIDEGMDGADMSIHETVNIYNIIEPFPSRPNMYICLPSLGLGNNLTQEAEATEWLLGADEARVEGHSIDLVPSASETHLLIVVLVDLLCSLGPKFQLKRSQSRLVNC